MLASRLHAQPRTIQTSNQLWVGYITDSKISQQYSIWNDFHWVPNGFALLRTGLTRNFTTASVTAGYAYGWLPLGSGNDRLSRHEHRPWAQTQLALPLSEVYTLTQRIRYEARFREKVSKGEVQDGYTFSNRIRYQISVKRKLLNQPNTKLNPYLSLSEEILLNFGKEVTANAFDQNRISLAFGLQSRTVQYQIGLMNRFVQTSPSGFTSYNMVVLWVTQKFDLRGWRK